MTRTVRRGPLRRRICTHHTYARKSTLGRTPSQPDLSLTSPTTPRTKIDRGPCFLRPSTSTPSPGRGASPATTPAQGQVHDTSSTTMIRPGREADEADVHVQPLPPPFFLSLPDLAHASIACFLPDGYRGKHSRLRVSEVSRDFFDLYGGTLTGLRVHHAEGRSVDRLAAFLQRQKKLVEVSLYKGEAIPALCQAMVEAAAKGLRRLRFTA